MKFTFKPPSCGACPQCIAFGRRWYITERNISNSDLYEHCLMSVSTEPQVTHKFQNLRKVTEWICGIADLSKEDDWYIKNWYLSRYIKYEDSEAFLLEKDDIQYRLDKQTFIITQLHRHIQETGWCSTYNECLNLAKEHLEKIKKEQNGEQLELFT